MKKFGTQLENSISQKKQLPAERHVGKPEKQPVQKVTFQLLNFSCTCLPFKMWNK